jgi:hypothetical protein
VKTLALAADESTLVIERDVLRATTRKKDGKAHRYWSVVESRRVARGRVVQRHVLYLGEINSSQELAWRKSIAVFEDGAEAPRTLSLFAEDSCEAVAPDASIVRLRLSALSVCRPRQFGACWLALELWRRLGLDAFWAARLPASRKGTRWDQVLFVLAAYRLIAPGSEWRLHREWFGRTALADLLGADEALADPHALYACHDRLLAHKEALFSHLVGRWRDLFNASFEVLLYDLTSTYFESDPPASDADKRRHGHSRDHRPDCVQVVIALVVTPEGLPLAYEVLAGNTADSTTLRDFLAKIERRYGKADRVWCMDRGIPTEAVLEEMRRADPKVNYLVGTPKGRLSRYEQALLAKPWHAARPGVRVKLLPEDGELYVFAESVDRVAKERSMRKRQLKWLWARLAQISAMTLTREAMLMKLGSARTKAPAAWRLVVITIDKEGAWLRLPPRSRQAAHRAPARGPLSAAHDARRNRPREAVDLLPAAGPGRGGVPHPQGRSRHPPDPSSARGPRRGACLHRLPRLLPARYAGPPARRAGARPQCPQRAREVRRRADGRRPHPDHRRPRDPPDPPHPARARTRPPARPPQARAPGPAAAENLRRASRRRRADVVKTYGGSPESIQLLNPRAHPESAKFG